MGKTRYYRANIHEFQAIFMVQIRARFTVKINVKKL